MFDDSNIKTELIMATNGDHIPGQQCRYFLAVEAWRSNKEGIDPTSPSIPLGEKPHESCLHIVLESSVKLW